MSVIYVHGGVGGSVRVLHRGAPGIPGPFAGYNWPGWFLNGVQDCESLCNTGMQAESMDCSGGCGAHPFYLKCFNALSPTPLNGKRVAFASQVGTTGLDPELLQMPIGNSSICKRM